MSMAIADQILDLEKQYWQAIKDQDAATAARLSDEPCLITGAQGISQIDRAQLASMVTAPPYRLHDFSIDNAQVRVIRDDVAVVAYNVHEELTVDGNRVALDAADASTWVRRNGRWVCALHTESLVGDPFGRDRGNGKAR